MVARSARQLLVVACAAGGLLASLACPGAGSDAPDSGSGDSSQVDARPVGEDAQVSSAFDASVAPSDGAAGEDFDAAVATADGGASPGFCDPADEPADGGEEGPGTATIDGWIDSAVEIDSASGRAYLGGWACAVGQEAPIRVSLWAGATQLGSCLADRPGEQAVGTRCGTTAHRFKMLLNRVNRLERFGAKLAVQAAGQALHRSDTQRMPGLNPNAPVDVPQVWFGPLSPVGASQTHGDAGGDFFNLFPSDGGVVTWPQSLSRLTAFQLYESWLQDRNYPDGGVKVPYAGTDEEIAHVVDFLRENDIAVGVEMCVVQPTGLALPAHVPDAGGCELHGLQSASETRWADGGIGRIAKIERVRTAVERVNAPSSGRVAELDYVALNEPFTQLYLNTNACFGDPGRLQALKDILADTAGHIRNSFPRVRIGLVEWLHDFGGQANTAATYTQLMEIYRGALGEYPAFFHFDVDLNGTDADAQEPVVQGVRTYCEARGIKFGIIYNGYREASDQAWTDRALARAQDYEADAGVVPNHAIFESWFDHPAQYVPESTPHTFTNLLADYLHWKGALP